MINKTAKLIEFQTKGDDRGRMVIFEALKDIPFEIKRVFYIYGTEPGVVRGEHANIDSEFMLINVSGTSKVKVDYGVREEIFELDRPHIGLYIPRMLWKEMYDFSDDSVLLVLSSHPYNPNEYIRKKEDYIKTIGKRV